MQHSSRSWADPKTRYYNPITKLRSLIQSLDAELLQLCNQCAPPRNIAPTKALIISAKSVVPTTAAAAVVHTKSRSSSNSNSHNSNSVKNTVKPSSMLANAHLDNTAGIHPRTLSSIYRAKVIDAYRNRRIFTVYGNYHTIRRALLRRGWLEKLAPGRYPKLQCMSEELLLQHAKRGNDFEAAVISKIINHFPAFFIWQPKGQNDTSVDVLPYRNRVRRARHMDFSTKVGLIGCAEQEQWFKEEGLCGMSYPRFYRLGCGYEDRAPFIEDFRQTQCRSLLRYILEHREELNVLTDEEKGTIPTSIIPFAVSRIQKQLADWEHSALDREDCFSTADKDQVEWHHFMENSEQVLQKGAKFKGSLKMVEEASILARSLLDKLEDKRPDYKWDGCRNLWILKPGYQCRGNGIIIRNSLDEILTWVSTNVNRRYIAQKYVERPLLIYKTKFDIRQYMLLSIGESIVQIWLYKDCYLRFSSQEFTVDDLRESIHLTNNSVQKKYKIKHARDPRLPKNNMWSLEQFKLYLKSQQSSDIIWDTKIYPGFKENLIAVVMASLEETEIIENAFEMYGCDFMLDTDYNPILIEINSTPDLSPSTEVTARICPLALKDLVKVIVDLPHNTRATTGQFELVYEVNYKTKMDFDPQVGLNVSGKAMTLCKTARSPPSRQGKKIKFFKKVETSMKSQIKTLKKISRMSDKSKSTDGIAVKVGAWTPKTLKSCTKEALALRYTLPK